MNDMNDEIVPAEFLAALEQLEEERHISKDMLLETIENALLSAYRKNYGTTSNVRVLIDPDQGQVLVLMRKDVVDLVEDDLTQISLEEAQEIDPRYEVGDYIFLDGFNSEYIGTLVMGPYTKIASTGGTFDLQIGDRLQTAVQAARESFPTDQEAAATFAPWCFTWVLPASMWHRS